MTKRINIFFLCKYIYLTLYNDIVTGPDNYKVMHNQTLDPIYLLSATLLNIFNSVNIFSFA